MKNFKKILLVGISYVLIAALAIGGTIAYLKDEDEAVNVMTLGNVYIEQIEQERDANGNLVPFKQGKPALPAVYEGSSIQWAPESEWPVSGDPAWKVVEDNANVVDKFVRVKNVGKSDAYVRTIIAFEIGKNGIGDPYMHLVCNGGSNDPWTFAWTSVTFEANDTTYAIGVFTYDEALKPGVTTVPSVKQIYLDKTATNEVCASYGETFEIIVLSQAIQTAGFANANAALNAGFGEVDAVNVAKWFGDAPVPALVDDAEGLANALKNGGDAILTDDIADAPANTTAPYGNWYGIAHNGGVFDGNGNTLDFDIGPMNDKGRHDNYGIMTSGGTIKNVTITGVFRGIMVMNPTEDIIIDNVTIGGDEDMCYGINTGEGDGTHSMTVTNSKVNGWNSFGAAISDLTFENCTFGQGEYYTDVFGRIVKPYVNTVFENCEFNSMFYIDLSQLGKDGDGNVLDPDAKIVIKNCTVNGVKLTAENWKSVIVDEYSCGAGQISIESKDGSYMTASNVLDYVIIE